MSQSRKTSLRETLTGTFIGMVGSWLITYVFVHAIANQGLAVTLATLGCTVWSIARGYTIRRYFNKRASAPININGLNAVAARQWMWVEKMGWHNSTILERLALIGSEVGEAVNECRGVKPSDEFGSELADIILRTIDLAHDKGIDIEAEIATKMAKNEAKGNYKGRVI